MTYSDPKVTYIDPTHLLLYLHHLVHTGLYHGDLEKYGWKEGRKVVATKFSVKHQGKYRLIYNLQSTNDLCVSFLG